MTGKGLPRDLWPIAIVVVLGAVMSILDVTIVNVALDTLHRDLHASLATIQWVASSYLLALVAVIPLTGWMAERYGARKVWMGSVAGFVVTSALCGLSWSAESLIAFRALQGVAGGMIMPIGMITMAQAAGPQRMGRVMSVIGVPMLLGPVCGPAVGGVLIDALSWRWIFFVNLPIGVVGLFLAWRLLPKGVADGLASRAGHALPPLDKVGLALLSPGVAAVVFALSKFGERGTLTEPLVWVPLVVGLVAVVAFVVRALRIEFPLIQIRLLRGTGFSAASASMFLLGASFFGSLLLLPLYFQLVRGASPLHAGLLMAPQGLGAAVSMYLGGRATDRYGAGKVVPVGILMMAIGTLPFVFVDENTSYTLLTIAMTVRGLGMGCSMMPAQVGAYATLPSAADVPRATPLLNVIQRTGGSVGVAAFTVLLSNNITAHIGERAAGAASGSSGSDLSDAARARIAPQLADAFAHTYVWVVVAILVGLLPALLLAREEHRIRCRKRAEESLAPRATEAAAIASGVAA